MKTVFYLFTLLIIPPVFSQPYHPEFAVKWAPTGLFGGNVSLLGEYGFGMKSSFTAKIGIPVTIRYRPDYDTDEADLKTQAFSFLGGYRIYLSRERFKGFYVEPFIKYLNHSTEGTAKGELSGDPVLMAIKNDYSAIGTGAQLGVQFLISKRFILDIYFFGPELNYATDEFRSVEVTNTISWTTVEANEAEQDIRDFIDQFPFIRNRVTVEVNSSAKTVNADFKGWLPGLRGGISLGISF